MSCCYSLWACLRRSFNRASALVFLLVSALSSSFLFAPLSQAQEFGLSDYGLGSGDLMSIQVFGEEDLSMEIRLSDAGTISYPFIGEIKVKGMTIGELGEYITTKLKDGYLINPSVNVTIAEYRQFYVNGEVENPGGFPFQPGLTLQKAVALAGGFTERASRSKIFITREGRTGSQDTFQASLQTKIQPSDIVNIDQSFF